MKLSDVEPEKNVTDLVVRVVSMAPPKMISTRTGRKTQLIEVLVADDTGSTILSLWGFNEGTDLSAGKVIRIIDGWAKEWRGKIQLSLGRSGKYEILVDDGSVPSISELGAARESTGEQ
ncbi:MAG: single-stranded DNA-binding protein [Candidatus Thorarchaeota archaeon]|nr:single-stranded DNA-binding protein [Candidatus Thorarchaeota archaeon]